MRRPYLILALCATAWGQISYVASTSVANPSTTTPAIDTTGATLLVVTEYMYNGDPCGYAAPVDSKSNTWTCAGSYYGGSAEKAYIGIWYSIPTSVGSGHTVTIPSVAHASAAFAAFSGTASSYVLDSKTGAGQATGSTLQPGSLTPTGNGELVITGASGSVNGTSVSSVDSPFSSHLVQNVAQGSGNGSVALAYEIQTTATARNPTWTFSTGSHETSAIIAAFLPYVAPPVPTISSYTLSLTQPWPLLPFDLSVTGTAFNYPPLTAYLCEVGGSCQAASNVTVDSPTSLTISSVSLVAGSWQIYVHTTGGDSSYSSPFTVANPGPVPAHIQHYPYLSNAVVLYGAEGYTPSSLWPSINTWLGGRFDWILGGSADGTGDAHGGNLTQTYYSTYVDGPEAGTQQGYFVQAFANANGYNLENIFLHSNADTTLSNTLGDTARFDMFEAYPYGTNILVGGVFTYSGSAYADVTQQTWNGSPSTSITNTLYVGYQEPFDRMNFVITTARTGGTVAYNYWNGSAWTALSSHFSDGTSGLTATGQVYWYPPSDWAQNTLTVNVTTPMAITTTNLKYWIQVVVSGASVSPVYSTVKGLDWAAATGSNYAFWGWNATDSHRINVGTRLEYNPTPPTGASARFRYQARAHGSWGGQMSGNPSNVVSGVRTWAAYLAYATDALLNPSDNYDSLFMDDAGNMPVSGLADATLDYNHTEGWTAAYGAVQTQLMAQLKSEHGPAFWVTNNSQQIQTSVGGSMLGDANLIEAAVMPGDWYTFSATINPFPDYITPPPSGGLPYDYFLTSTNPNNVKGYAQYFDMSSLVASSSWSPQNTFMSNWHFADRANRTPMLTLAMHYIGSNANTGYMYHGGQESIISPYISVDQVDTYTTPTTLASPISADTSSNPKTITLTSNANCVGRVYPDMNWATIVLQIGATGDVVGANAGTVIAQTNNATGQLWGGYPTTLLNQFPNSTIQAGYNAPFSHLSFVVTSPGGATLFPWKYWNGTAWASLTVTDGTNMLHNSGDITWTPPGDWATTTVSGVTGYWVVGTLDTTHGSTTVSTIRSSDWTALTTTNPIYNSYPAGTAAYCVQSQHLASITAPSVANVWGWTRWFPAMGVDLGAPTGARQIDEAGNTAWRMGSVISGHSPIGDCGSTGCPNVWRRDFADGIVLMRPFRGSLHLEAELDTPSQPIALGGTYYPLKADGTLGAGVTSITLRAAEAAILMGSPIPPTTSKRPIIKGPWNGIR